MPVAPDVPPVILTIDCVLLTLLGQEPDGLAVALQNRPKEPFAGMPALPGGYVHADADADLDATARRVLADKLGLSGEGLFLEQLGTVSGARRDPRGWSASVVYYALVPRERLMRAPDDHSASPRPSGHGLHGFDAGTSTPVRPTHTPHPEVPRQRPRRRPPGIAASSGGLLRGLRSAPAPQDEGEGGTETQIRTGRGPSGGGDALQPRHLRLVPVDALPQLAFDHAAIIAKAIERLRAKTGYSNLPGFLLPQTFTMPELIAVYERVLGQTLDQSVFRRRMDELGLIEPVPDAFRKGGRHRPAQLYRLTERKASLHDRIVAQKPRGRGGA